MPATKRGLASSALAAFTRLRQPVKPGTSGRKTCCAPLAHCAGAASGKQRRAGRRGHKPAGARGRGPARREFGQNKTNRRWHHRRSAPAACCPRRWLRRARRGRLSKGGGFHPVSGGGRGGGAFAFRQFTLEVTVFRCVPPGREPEIGEQRRAGAELVFQKGPALGALRAVGRDAAVGGDGEGADGGSA